MFELLERGVRGIERRADSQRVERRLPCALARVGARAERFSGGNGRELARIERVDADLAGGELQCGNLELAGPLARLGHHSAGDAVTTRRSCRDAPVGLARRAEAQPVRGEAVDDELLFGERHDVEIRDQLVGLQEVAEGFMRAGDGQAPDHDFAVRQIEMEVSDLDLRADHLRADLLRCVPGDRIGKKDPQHPDDTEEHEQRSDRLPAEDLDPGRGRSGHGRNIR